jgi:hypothetical protein
MKHVNESQGSKCGTQRHIYSLHVEVPQPFRLWDQKTLVNVDVGKSFVPGKINLPSLALIVYWGLYAIWSWGWTFQKLSFKLYFLT